MTTRAPAGNKVSPATAAVKVARDWTRIWSPTVATLPDPYPAMSHRVPGSTAPAGAWT